MYTYIDILYLNHNKINYAKNNNIWHSLLLKNQRVKVIRPLWIFVDMYTIDIFFFLFNTQPYIFTFMSTNPKCGFCNNSYMAKITVLRKFWGNKVMNEKFMCHKVNHYCLKPSSSKIFNLDVLEFGNSIFFSKLKEVSQCWQCYCYYRNDSKIFQLRLL